MERAPEAAPASIGAAQTAISGASPSTPAAPHGAREQLLAPQAELSETATPEDARRTLDRLFNGEHAAAGHPAETPPIDEGPPRESRNRAWERPTPALETDLSTDVELRRLAKRVAPTFDALPLDRFRRPGAAGRRFRAAAQALIEPGAGGAPTLRVSPGASFRSEDGTVDYPGIAPEVARDPAFRELLLSFYRRLPEKARDRGVRVSIHQMRVEDGEVSPEGLHQDRFTDYLGMWVAGRRNAAGGESRLFADPRGERTLLSAVLSPDRTLLFDNRALWHRVTRIERAAPDAGPARRDVFVFAFQTLPPGRPLSRAERAAALHAIRAEFRQERPDAALLRTLFEKGDARVQEALYRAFKTWSRFFSSDRDMDRWRFLKRAAAPWASEVYVKKVKSYLEFLQEAHASQVDVSGKAAQLHRAAESFAETFVQAAEKRSPQDLDRDEAATTIIDAVLTQALLDPLLEKRQRGPFDRAALLDDMARRIKDSVYLYSDMSVEAVREVLESGKAREALESLVGLLEEQIPDAPRAAPASASPGTSQAAPRRTGRSARAVKTSLLALLAVALNAAGVPFTETDSLATTLPMLGLFAASLSHAAPETTPAGAPPAAGRPPAAAGYLLDLTALARRGELDPVYLRDEETTRAIQILNQRAYNNVVLLGEPGVGKTAIAEGLALRVAAKATGTPLDEQRVLLLDSGKFFAAGAGSPDRFAAAVEEVLTEAADGRTVLVIDEAHTLARDPSTPLMFGSFFDQVRRAMTQGRLRLMLATTRAEYDKYFASDRALESRSEKLYVEAVPEALAMELLDRLRTKFERGVTIAYPAVKAAVELTVRAFRFDALLRMAIKALDTAATRLTLRPATVRRRLLDTRRELLYHLDVLRRARVGGDLQRQETLVPQLNAMIERYDALAAESAAPPRRVVGREDVEDALREAGAPAHSLHAGTAEHLRSIEALLRANLIGRDGLIDATLSALRRRYAQPNVRKPVLSALLLGPTGTGKTEFARLLGRALFDAQDADKDIIKINGGELKEKHFITRLTGAPPSYVGFGETETLFDQVRRKPESVILVDEVEKMHPDTLDLFLSILEDGSARDSRGRLVDFSHAVVILTSNFGLPAGYEKLRDAELVKKVRAALEMSYPASPFKPEFRNRLDLIDVFPTFKKEQVSRILELRIAQLRERWRSLHDVEVAFEDPATAERTLLLEGFDRANGARPLNRTLNQRIEAVLSERLIARKLQRGDRAIFSPDWTLRVERGSRARRAPALAGRGSAQAAADALEALLKGLAPDAALALDDLDRALDTPLPASAASADLALRTSPDPATEGSAPEAVVLREHRPNRADPELASALERLERAVRARPDFQPEALLKAVKALALKARRLNLEAEARRRDGPLWERGFGDLERELGERQGALKRERQEWLAAVVRAAGRDRTVRLDWRLEAERALIRLTSDSRLTYEEEVRLLSLFAPAADAAPVGDAASDVPLLQARRGAPPGARFGYERGERETVLWLGWPLPAAKALAAPAADSEPASERATLLPPPEGRKAPTAALAVEEKSLARARASMKRHIEAASKKSGDEAASDELVALELMALVEDISKSPRAASPQLRDKLLEMIRERRPLTAAFRAHGALAEARPDLFSKEALSDALAGPAGEFRRLARALSLPQEKSRPTPQHLRRLLKHQASAADAAIERLFRDALQTSSDDAVGAYLELIRARPDLLPADIAEPLRREVGSRRDGETVTAFLARRERFNGLARDLDAARPDLRLASTIAEASSATEGAESLALLEAAGKLLDPKAEEQDVVGAANALAAGLAENPAAATPELEAALESGVKAHWDYLHALMESRDVIEAGVVADVGGRHVPVRRFRELIGGFRRLLELRPDLAPAGLAELLARAFGLERLRVPERAREIYTVDIQATEVFAWNWRQAFDLALLLSERRPDLIGYRDLLGYHDLAEKRVNETRTPVFPRLSIPLILSSLVGLALGSLQRWGFESDWIGWPILMAVFPALLALRLAVAAAAHRKENAKHRRMREGFFQRALERARTSTPQDVLDAIGAFDAETAAWKAAAGKERFFKELKATWPEFRAEAEGASIAKQGPASAPAALVKLAKTATDLDVAPAVSLDAVLRLARDLQGAPALASPELEAVLRAGAERVFGLATNGWEPALPEGKKGFTSPRLSRGELFPSRSRPDRQAREILELYQRLLVARPDLAPRDLPAWLRRALVAPYSTDFGGHNAGENDTKVSRNAATAWLADWAARTAAAVERVEPGLAGSWRDALELYRQDFREDGVKRFTPTLVGFPDSHLPAAVYLAATMAGVGALTLAAAWITGYSMATLAWLPATALAIYAFFAAINLTSWRRARALAREPERRLLEVFARKAPQAQPREVLDALSELDPDRSRWFPKPGVEALFERLLRDWPDFKKAAGAG